MAEQQEAEEARAPRSRSAGNTALRRVLLAVVAAGLVVDVDVHWHLAGRFDSLRGSGSPSVSQGQLFRVEAALALAALLLVLLVRRRAAVLFALAVAAGGAVAVVVYRYVDVGGVGPVPDMYDPSWYAGKTISAVAEALAAAAALALLFLPAGRSGRS